MIKVIEKPIDLDLIALLEDLVKKAKEGELISLAMSMQVSQAATATAFHLGSGDIAHLYLAIERLKLRLLEEGLEELGDWE